MTLGQLLLWLWGCMTLGQLKQFTPIVFEPENHVSGEVAQRSWVVTLHEGAVLCKDASRSQRRKPFEVHQRVEKTVQNL